MPSIGPDLPPHLLAKRKRKAEEAPATDATIQQSAQPQSQSPARSQSPTGEKRQRVVGPAPPPAPLDERPSEPADDSDSDSSDDDFGPAPPTAQDVVAAQSRRDDENDWKQAEARAEAEAAEKNKPQRDEWMMLPPQQDDLAARMDPTKIRARKFNTGKGAKAPSGGASSNSLWTETPEQKAKRLQDQVMGIGDPSGGGEPGSDAGAKRKAREKEEATRRKVKEHDEQHRGKSLYEQHQGVNKVEEDDPSKRAFDREKDMAVAGNIGRSQKKEMMSKAAGFGSRFAGGGYL